MKVPSLTRLPKNKRFNFQPRYYDPVKEEIDERTRRIREELDSEASESYRERISTAFRRRSRANKSAGIMQFGFVIMFAGIFFGYIFFGKYILYAFLVFIPFYIWLKFKGRA